MSKSLIEKLEAAKRESSPFSWPIFDTAIAIARQHQAAQPKTVDFTKPMDGPVKFSRDTSQSDMLGMQVRMATDAQAAGEIASQLSPANHSEEVRDMVKAASEAYRQVEEALRFYADKENHAPQCAFKRPFSGTYASHIEVNDGNGNRAREALTALAALKPQGDI